MAKATLKERIVRSIRHPAGGDTVRRFVDGPARQTQPVQRTVRAGTVDVEARTLTAVVATDTSRIMDIYDDDLDAWITVEEIVLVDGMDFGRVESGMQFLDNHNSWDRAANLGVVTEARTEDVEGVGLAVVADILMSSRPELDSLIQDLADGIVGCISCQYRPIESTLELRDGDYPLLTHTKSELLEVSLVSVPADPHALVRSETSLKGKDMAPKPTGGAREAAKRGFAARTAKRADDAPGATDALDEAAIAEIVAAAIEEATPLIVEETLAAARAEGDMPEMTDDEKKAKEEAEAAAAEEAKKKEAEDAGAGGSTESRSAFVRSLVAKALGRSSAPAKGAEADLTLIRSMADKYGVRKELNDMEAMKVPVAELRSFVANATASRSGTGLTHDGRTITNSRSSDQLVSWNDTARGKRSAQRSNRR